MKSLGTPKLWLLVAAASLALRDILEVWIATARPFRPSSLFAGLESAKLTHASLALALFLSLWQLGEKTCAITPRWWLRALVGSALGGVMVLGWLVITGMT